MKMKKEEKKRIESQAFETVQAADSEPLRRSVSRRQSTETTKNGGGANSREKQERNAGSKISDFDLLFPSTF